jgi:hypothetical protein
MQCYSHNSTSAVGICRACGKGLCPACAREIKVGIVCSDPCREFVETQTEMTERAKRVYSMGEHRQKFPGPALIFILMGVLMLAVGGVSALSNIFDAIVPGGMGFIFLVAAFIAWRRAKFTGLTY